MRISNPVDYHIWKNNHEKDYQLNCVGSSPSMEAAGAKNIFSRSESNYDVRYTGFVGDGDI